MSKCTIRKIVKKDKEKLSDFVMKNFVPNEALMTEHIDNDVTIFDQARVYLEDQFEDTLKDDCSFIAVEEDTGDIKGIRINRIGHRCGKYKNTDEFGVEMQSVATFMYEVEKAALSNHSNFMRHVIICVARDALKSGVATQLNRQCHLAAVENGLSLMTATCTWKVPEILAIKSGYKLLVKREYEDFVVGDFPGGEKIKKVYGRLSEKHGHYSVLTKEV